MWGWEVVEGADGGWGTAVVAVRLELEVVAILKVSAVEVRAPAAMEVEVKAQAVMMLVTVVAAVVAAVTAQSMVEAVTVVLALSHALSVMAVDTTPARQTCSMHLLVRARRASP